MINFIWDILPYFEELLIIRCPLGRVGGSWESSDIRIRSLLMDIQKGPV